ncbi:hypothetical protein LguiB_026876 [Lonicera macranthoides]
MGSQAMESKLHIMMIIFPAQGHINPMLHFSKRLATKGLKITLVTTNPTPIATAATSTSPDPINVETIAFGPSDKPETIEDHINRYKETMLLNLPKIITNHSIKGDPIKVLVYDAVMPWALDLCQPLGIKGAAFFTQSCAVTSIYYHKFKGTLDVPNDGSLVNMPGVKPILGICDLPSFIYDLGYQPSTLKVVVEQSLNYGKADWLFFNSFDMLEDEVNIEPKNLVKMGFIKLIGLFQALDGSKHKPV